MACPDVNEIAALVDGRLEDKAIESLQHHLDTCSTCFALVAELARGDDVDATAGPEATSEAGSWHASRQLDEYRLVRPLGRGSGGQVWLAVDTLLDREVAIKFLSAASRARARDRFSIEVRAVARLNHPNVVTVFRVGDVGGQPYLVSEVVHGESLDATARPMPWRRAREIGIGLARGLAAAHRAGIIHRDIKPANAIVGADGAIKLLDFGLAKLTDSDEIDDASEDSARSPSMTVTGQLLGTPLYMAPEAWQRDAPAFTMDVYSLGALVYELCAGAPPHTAPTLGELRRVVLEERPRALAALVPGIDASFAAVIDRCLARDPADRFADGEELRRALEATVRAPRTRRRWLAAAALGVAAASAIAFASLRPSGAERVHAPTPQAPQRCSADRWCWDAAWVGAFFSVWGPTPGDVWTVGERGVVRHLVAGSWKDVSTGSVADFYHVAGTAADDVWVVGSWGTIMHWDGGGWHEIASGTHATLYGVWSATRDDAWIVGEGGLILRWDGRGWRTQPSPTTQSLTGIAGSSGDDVWVTGNSTALHWDGKAWSVADPRAHELIQPIAVAGPRDAWLVGFHSVIRHYDGTSWAVVAVPEVAAPTADDREDFPFNGGAGSADDLWLIAKSGGFLHRIAGAWSKVDQGTHRELYSMHVFAHDDAWAVGAGGAIVHWDGTSWRAVGVEQAHRSTRGLWARGPEDIWAVGVQTDEHAHLRALVRHFDGRSWVDVPAPDVPSLQAVAGRGEDLWAVGDHGTILRRRDGAFVSEASGTTATLDAIWIDAPGHAWVVGDGTILRYDGTWHVVPGARGNLHGIWGASSADAWAVGTEGALHLTGGTWQPVATGTAEPLFAVWGADANDVWAVGDHGAIVRWDGRSWTTVYSDFAEPLAAISGSRRDDVWAVSNNDQGTPSIIHFDGQSWTRIERTTHAPLAAIVAVGVDEAWAAGPWNTFLHHPPTM